MFIAISNTDSYKYNLKRIHPIDAQDRSKILDEIALNQLTLNINILKYFDAYDYDNYI